MPFCVCVFLFSCQLWTCAGWWYRSAKRTKDKKTFLSSHRRNRHSNYYNCPFFKLNFLFFVCLRDVLSNMIKVKGVIPPFACILGSGAFFLDDDMSHLLVRKRLYHHRKLNGKMALHFICFVSHIILQLNRAYLERILVSVNNIISKSSYTWFKIDKKKLTKPLMALKTPPNSIYFYRTRVRSLEMLVTNSLTNWLTDSLTDSCLVNLIDVTLAWEDAYSKLVEAATVADVSDEDRVGNSLLQIWKLRFGHKA